MSICTKIEYIKALDENVDLMKVGIDDTIEAYMVNSYGEALKFVDKEVVVTYRQDLLEGSLVTFINTFTELSKINVLSKTSSIKLFSKDVDNNCTICFKDIAEGDVVLNAVVFCSDVSFQSSQKAQWADLTCVDKMRRVAHIRLFDPDTREPKFKGNYVQCDIRRSQYGFSTQVISPMRDKFAINPEVNIAQRYITDVFANNEKVLDFIYKSKLFVKMEEYVDYEPGYLTVRTAIELAIAGELVNIFEDVDIAVIKQAILMDKIFVLNTESVYSRDVTNIVLLSKYDIDKRKETSLVLDSLNTTVSSERLVFEDIKRLANTILKVKKGGLL
ncbi:MAG: hypothetical protein LBS29_04920 [Endomicrobium sp.]|jgi:hypothetical protein|nr:hypothetical protein [Endomicrobium sp.]